MMRTRTQLILASAVGALALLLLLPRASVGELSAAAREGLASSKYVYIASTRKDGSLGTPAEIWFFYHQGAVYVGTPPTSWRVRRIRWGRPQAKIWVGKPDGPSFTATGAIVQDREMEALLLGTFAKKYPDGWARYAERFRSGFKDGSRVLVKYTPTDS